MDENVKQAISLVACTFFALTDLGQRKKMTFSKDFNICCNFLINTKSIMIGYDYSLI